MEGPFISPKKVGAQNPEYVQGADEGMLRRLQKRAGGLIKLVDVAPEEPGNLDFIKECHNEVRIDVYKRQALTAPELPEVTEHEDL